MHDSWRRHPRAGEVAPAPAGENPQSESHLGVLALSLSNMTRVDASLPEPLAALLEAAVDEGLFKGTSDAARVASREHFADDDERRLAAVQALVEATPPSADGSQGLSLTDVVRLTGRLPTELPEEIRVHYDIPGEEADADPSTGGDA